MTIDNSLPRETLQTPGLFSLNHPKTIILIALIIMALTLYPYLKIGSEFMPALDEGLFLYAGHSARNLDQRAAKMLRITDRVLKQVLKFTGLRKGRPAETAQTLRL